MSRKLQTDKLSLLACRSENGGLLKERPAESGNFRYIIIFSG